MRRKLVFLSIFLGGLLFSQEKIAWYQNLEKAKSIAMKGKKPLLVFFADSSICAQKMQEIFQAPSFQDKGRDLFTFCLLDTKELPKVVLIDPEYGRITKMGYIPSSKVDYLQLMQEKIQIYLQIKKAASRPNEYNLEKIYTQALKLDCEYFQEKLLEAGLKQDKGIFFLLAQYENLLKKYPLYHQNLQRIQEEIEKKDPKNLQKGHLKIAMLHFQTLALQGAPTKEVVAPLIEYVQKFQKKDRKNLWKVYLTISQYLSVQKKYPKALTYARLSYKEAPKEAKKNILSCIKYLKKKRSF